ncbi:hypothetical protein [Streptomyces longispororuber]|uniref:hypothetical protein n=1 Tax=Streptomyces longispororuber TaxID=68230 RepID=UPI00210C9A3A|nr:hypothetical protein [Streptomyces longispororuber]MCQ4209352.1 hypothetical protein [Streptomyces longispororuber]
MKPQAEVEQVWPRDGRIRVVGRLHGVPPDAGSRWRLQLTRRSRTDHVLRYDADLDGARFACGWDVGGLAAYDGFGAADQWDLHLTDGARTLRVGRKLDDIRGKKAVMVYPEQRVPGADFGVRPYFTVEDNLSLECRS